jgi:hypothetical protein
VKYLSYYCREWMQLLVTSCVKDRSEVVHRQTADIRRGLTMMNSPPPSGRW